jgi:hypothetical protein
MIMTLPFCGTRQQTRAPSLAMFRVMSEEQRCATAAVAPSLID